MKFKLYLGLVALFILFANLPSLRADESEIAKAKILFIGKKPDHPHGTHMYLDTCRMLAKCVEKNGNIETVVSQGWPTDPESLKGVKTIVLYSTPGAEFLLDGPGAGEFHKMMRSGVGLVTLHWASSVFEKNLKRLSVPWGEYLGGYWVSNYGLSTEKSQLKQLVTDHPICRGWKSTICTTSSISNQSCTKPRRCSKSRRKAKS